MAKVNYYLMGENDTKNITLFFSYEGIRLKISTGLQITASHWNEKTQRVRGNANLRGNPKVMNDLLDRYSRAVNDLYLKLKQEKKQVTNEVLRELMKIEMGHKTSQETQDVLTFIEEVIEERRASNMYSKETIKTYITVKNHLKLLLGTKRLLFDEIDKPFWENFRNYFAKNGVINSSIAKNFRTIKTLLAIAIERGVEGSGKTILNTKNINLKIYDRVAIYLTDDELQKIYDLDLSKNKKLEKVRDAFYVGSYTGLRFSDFSKLNSHNVVDNTIQVINQKTRAKVIVPLKPTILRIIAKYDGQFPPAISNQKTNKYIKEVAKLAGIDEKISVVTFVGQTKKEVVKCKYELVSTHSARRSFATNSYLSGVPIPSIMLMTGHKTQSEFFKYIRISQAENANNLAQHPYFQ
jgi:integrase